MAVVSDPDHFRAPQVTVFLSWYTWRPYGFYQVTEQAGVLCLFYPLYPQLEKLAQRCFKAGPTSTTLAQLWNSVVQTGLFIVSNS